MKGRDREMVRALAYKFTGAKCVGRKRITATAEKGKRPRGEKRKGYSEGIGRGATVHFLHISINNGLHD